MKPARLVLTLPLIFGLQACAAFTGVEATNLEPVLVGAQRAEIEAVLGDPSESKPNGCGSVDTYDYNRGRHPEPALVALGMVHPAAPLVVGLISHPFLYYGQKADLDVVYDPHDTVIKYGPRDLRDWEALFSNNHLWVDQTTEEEVAEHYHRIGMAATTDGNTARTCLCQAALLGHPDSQIYLADVHEEVHEQEVGPANASLAPPSSAPPSSAPALQSFETAASKDASSPISEMSPIEIGVTPAETGVTRQTDAPVPPPPVPPHVIARACGAPPAEIKPSG